MFGWVPDFAPVREIIELPWDRIQNLAVGEQLALLAMAVVSGLVGLMALNRFLAVEFSKPLPRSEVPTPRRKKGFGLRYLWVLAAAVLPGGLVATFTVPLLMGKERWREDALRIFLISLIPLFGLVVLHVTGEELLHELLFFWISALVGLTFSILQVWLGIKLLREALGEPEECVAWWPPLAFCAQIALLYWTLHLSFYV